MKRISILILITLSFLSFAQKKNPNKQKNLSWEELNEMYECPEWFKDAKLGIFSHWGPQSKPEYGGGWYARHMYMQDVGREEWGRNAYKYQCENYGHPSEKGFKDVIHSWKAEHLDTDDVIKSFKAFGAKYVVIMANHHDHFDNFDSSHHPWNSVNMGPKRDIVGEFGKSIRKQGLKFGVSVHDDRFLHWFKPAFGADKTGPLKGVPYDGHMTKEDGKGKWWEGYDPADLYGLPPGKRTDEWVEGVKKNWADRHLELVDKYNIDMFWFDGYDLPYGKYGDQVATHLYNKSLKENGKIEAVITGKDRNTKAIIQDVERGVAEELRETTWQGTMTFTAWFYKLDRSYKHNTRTVLESLVDAVSKNGNLLMSVELYPDGRIVKEQKEYMQKVGEWLKVNGKAIYGSRPWKIYGDGSTVPLSAKEMVGEADLDAKKENKGAHFNERTVDSEPYSPDEVRYTSQGNILYMTVLNPSPGILKVPSLGLKASTRPGKIESVKMLGNSRKKIEFQQKDMELELNIPVEFPSEYPVVFKIEGVIK